MKQAIIEGLGTKPATKPRKKTNTNTNDLTTAVCAYINMRNNSLAWRVNNGGTYNAARKCYIKGNTTNGVPDVEACVKGLYYAIEIKTGSDKLSDGQLNFKDKIEKAGGIYIECRNLQQIIDIFA